MAPIFQKSKLWKTQGMSNIFEKEKKKRWRDKVFSFHSEIRLSGVKQVKDFQGNSEVCPWERGLYPDLSIYTEPINVCGGA